MVCNLTGFRRVEAPLAGIVNVQEPTALRMLYQKEFCPGPRLDERSLSIEL